MVEHFEQVASFENSVQVDTMASFLVGFEGCCKGLYLEQREADAVDSRLNHSMIR